MLLLHIKMNDIIINNELIRIYANNTYNLLGKYIEIYNDLDINKIRDEKILIIKGDKIL